MRILTAILPLILGVSVSIQAQTSGAAIETGTYKTKGTNKGKAFDESGRYTTTWVWRGGRGQIAADHTSVIKNP